jgi:hypothetical protein
MGMIHKIIFWLTHPLWVLGYSLLALLWADAFAFGPDPGLSVVGALISATVLPAAALLVMRLLKLGAAGAEVSRLDQIGPLLIVAVFYLWLFRNVYGNPQLDTSVQEIALGALISLFLGFFINLFEKVPFHMLGLGYLSATLFIIHFFYGNGYLPTYQNTQVNEINSAFLPALALLFTGMAAWTNSTEKASLAKQLAPWITGLSGPFFAFWIL